MKPGDLSHTFFSGFDKDFKAEVVAAEMVEHGTPADRILILLLGALKRPFSKDVDSINEEFSEYDHNEYLVVKTSKEGIYDMLPEGLFHNPSAHKSAKTETDILKIMKQRREEERLARKFFLPFEATINFLRMQMVLYENRLDKRSHYDDLVRIFSDHWEIFKYLDARQSNIFLHLIPIMHDIRDDRAVIETVMEMIFLLPVQISLRKQLPLYPANLLISTLEESRLGVDFTTGNTVYNEGVDEMLIKIGPLKNEAFRDFMPGGTRSRILTFLLDYFLPAHLDSITEFVPEDENRITRLADELSDFNSILGADTYL